MADRSMTLGVAGIVFGVLLYLGAVVGLWSQSATSPVDVGATSASIIFILLGLGGVLMSRQSTAA